MPKAIHVVHLCTSTTSQRRRPLRRFRMRGLSISPNRTLPAIVMILSKPPTFTPIDFIKAHFQGSQSPPSTFLRILRRSQIKQRRLSRNNSTLSYRPLAGRVNSPVHRSAMSSKRTKQFVTGAPLPQKIPRPTLQASKINHSQS